MVGASIGHIRKRVSSLVILLHAMLDDVQAWGSGRVRLGWVGSGQVRFGVRTDVASASRSLHQLNFHVWDLVADGGHVARSDGEKSREARGL